MDKKRQMFAGIVVFWMIFAAFGAAATNIADADGDTKVQTEESADEDKIRFDTGGTERMIIDNGGYVGVGDTTPDAMLDVDGTFRVDGARATFNGASEKYAANFKYNSATNGFWIGGDTDQSLKFSNAGGTTHMTILSGGNVGIGTTSPVEKLHVSGGNVRLDNGYNLRWKNNAGSPGAYFTQSGNDFYIANSDNAAIYMQTNGQNRIMVSSVGNVGIGTTSPGNTLHVAGTGDQGVRIEKTDATTNSWDILTRGEYLDFVETGVASRMVLEDGGNVGIGTTSPGAKLDTAGFVRSTNEGGAPTSGTGIQMFYHSSQDKGYLTAYDYSASSYEEMFINNAITIQSDGDVGIGDTTPDAKLDVEGDAILAANGHLNFGSTSGVTGYGIRDNAGTVQYKNSGGSWTNIGTAGEDYEEEDHCTEHDGDGVFCSGETLNFDCSDVDGDGIGCFNEDLQINAGTGVSITSDTLHFDCSEVNAADSIRCDGEHIQAFALASENGVYEQTVYVDNNGNVGVGTTTPNAQLEVDGTSKFNGVINTNNQWISGDGGNEGIYIDDNGDVGIGTSTPAAKLDVRGDAVFNNAAGNNDFRIEGTTEENLLFVDADANKIGIGTSTPGEILDLVSASDLAIQLTRSAGAQAKIALSGSYAEVGTTTNHDFKIKSNNSELIRVSQDGFVGIANPDPEYLIDILDDGTKTIIFNTRDKIDGSSLFSINVEENDEGVVEVKDNGVTKVKLDSNGHSYFTGGNIGIGITNPSAKLEVAGTSKFNGVINTNNQWISGDGQNEGLYVDDDGDVGIGTTSPSEELEVNGDIKVNSYVKSDGHLYLDSTENIYINPSDDIYLTPGFNDEIYIGGDTLVVDTYDEQVGINTYYPNAGLDVLANEPNSYAAWFQNDGDNDNRYGVKIQSGEDDGSDVYSIRFFDGDASPSHLGFIGTDAGGDLGFYDTSDARLKENIVDSNDVLDKINQIKVRDFNFIGNNNKVTGFVAQELLEIFPDAVKLTPELKYSMTKKVGTEVVTEEIIEPETYSVNKLSLVPKLVKAVQELSDKNDALEAKNTDLEAENTALKNAFCEEFPQNKLCKAAA